MIWVHYCLLIFFNILKWDKHIFETLEKYIEIFPTELFLIQQNFRMLKQMAFDHKNNNTVVPTHDNKVVK